MAKKLSTPEQTRMRLERIASRKEVIGSQEDRMLRNYTKGFLQIFDFFTRCYKEGILTFCGNASISVVYDSESPDARLGFREYDNGKYQSRGPEQTLIQSSDPDALYAVVTAKKAWGLWVRLWAEAIAEGTFIKTEVWETFTNIGIGIPLEKPEKISWLGQQLELSRDILKLSDAELYSLYTLDQEFKGDFRGISDEYIYGFDLYMPTPLFKELENAIWTKRFDMSDNPFFMAGGQKVERMLKPGDLFRALYSHRFPSGV